MKLYEQRGIDISCKIFFATNPRVTAQHRILITERNGEPTSNLNIEDIDNPDVFDVVSYTDPDASVGLGLLWKVMVKNKTSRTN